MIERIDTHHSGFCQMVKTDKWQVAFITYSDSYGELKEFKRHMTTDEVIILIHGSAILYTYENDEIVEIPVEKDVVYNILENIIFEIEDRLKDKNLKLNLTHRAKEYIIENSYDPNYGARPIRRYVQANIETLIAKNIIEGNINFGQIINIDVKNEKLEII